MPLPPSSIHGVCCSTGWSIWTLPETAQSKRPALAVAGIAAAAVIAATKRSARIARRRLAGGNTKFDMGTTSRGGVGVQGMAGAPWRTARAGLERLRLLPPPRWEPRAAGLIGRVPPVLKSPYV